MKNNETTLLEAGDIIELKPGHKVYADIPKHFVYANCRGDFTMTHSEVTIGDQFDYLAGQYVVYKTAVHGGGTAHGPNDVYPDGHHVYCERVDDPSASNNTPRNIKVDFYQTGCFTAMIEDIQPIGRAEHKWVKPS